MELFRTGRIEPQHAQDIQLVPVGVDVKLGDQPRQRQLIINDIADLVAVQLLNRGEHTDHHAEQRQENAGEEKNLFADRHPNPRTREVRVTLQHHDSYCRGQD